MNSDLIAASKEGRGWAKILQKGNQIKTVQDTTDNLNKFKIAFSELNSEVKDFNGNLKKSNNFLSQIANLQRSMDRQAKAANKFTWVVVILAIIQVAIAIIAYFKP